MVVKIMNSMKRKSFRKWHLAKTETDNTIVELEWALMRFMTAFNRYNENIVKSISGHTLSASEINLLHVLRMHDTPKTAGVLASLLNRHDYSNIQYGLRKLRELKLIRLHAKSGTKQYSYEMTAEGTKITDKFVVFREENISEPIGRLHDWEEKFDATTQITRKLTGIYEDAAREALAYWEDDDQE